MENNFLVTSSPHIRAPRRTQLIMLDVIIALMPAVIASVIFFGPRALLVIGICVATAIVVEWLCRLIMRRENTIMDLSAIVTGILVALNLPVSIHPVIAALGSVIAIAAVKQLFGGLGQNFVNPALTARIVLLVSFPSQMSNWFKPFYYALGLAPDAVTTATGLAISSGASEGVMPNYLDMFLGNTAGSLGETCAIALLMGGIYLCIRRVINPFVPGVFIATVALISLIFGRDILMDLLSGGLLLGAIFMATDYATTPLNFKGKLIFAFGCGVLTMMIRMFASLPEGVSYAIVIMNVCAPLIERWTRPISFGKIKSMVKKG